MEYFKDLAINLISTKEGILVLIIGVILIGMIVTSIVKGAWRLVKFAIIAVVIYVIWIILSSCGFFDSSLFSHITNVANSTKIG